MLRLVGIEQARLARDWTGLAFAVRDCNVDYRAPAKLDDLLEVRSRLTGSAAPAAEAEQDDLAATTRPWPGSTCASPVSIATVGRRACRRHARGAEPIWNPTWNLGAEIIHGEPNGRHSLPWTGRSHDLTIWGLFLEADIVVKVVILILLLWRPSGLGDHLRKDPADAPPARLADQFEEALLVGRLARRSLRRDRQASRPTHVGDLRLGDARMAPLERRRAGRQGRRDSSQTCSSASSGSWTSPSGARCSAWSGR